MVVPPSQPSLPIVSLSTRGPRLTGRGTLLQSAGLAGIRWIDLELSGRVFSDRPASIIRTAGACGVNLRSIWVPAVGGFLGFGGPSTRAELVGTLVAATGARAVVMDRPSGSGRKEERQARLLQAIREKVPPAARLTLALRPESLLGNREHLEALVALRRQAEEWDFDLALDLDGPIDPTWESEAAVSKILPRLTVVRIGPLESRPPGRGRERQTARVLAFLADLGYRETIAISAAVPLWRADRTVALVRSCQDVCRTILARYEAIHDEPRIDTSSRWGPGIEMPG